jgi:hypothetical protein
MREDFGDNENHLIQDLVTSKKYIIKHHIGNTYTLRTLNTCEDLLSKTNGETSVE